jgi:hypothetical protein
MDAMSAAPPGHRGLRPEARFITLCLREPDETTPSELRAAALAVRDWPALLELARRHTLIGFVRRATIRESLVIPASVERHLREAEHASVQQVMQLDLALAGVLEGLAADAVTIIVLKGPVLSRTIYPRKSLRPYADVDLTVQEEHEARVADALQSQGFSETEYEAEEARREHAGHIEEASPFHRMFESADGQVLFEVHVDPLQLGLRTACEAARWERAEPVPGLPGALMLGPADQLVQLSVHAHKHGYSRLIWLKDLDLLLRTQADRIDWDLVVSTASEEGVDASVWYSLRLAERLLGSPFPAPVLARLAPNRPLRALYDLVWPVRRIANLEGFDRRRAVQFHPAERWRGMLPSLVLMGRRRERARAIARAIFHR